MWFFKDKHKTIRSAIPHLQITKQQKQRCSEELMHFLSDNCKTDLGENAAAVLTATQEIQTDYTCPWTTALSWKYESDMLVRYEPAEIIRKQHTAQSKAAKTVCSLPSVKTQLKHSFIKD